MTARVEALGCPRCGGALAVGPGRRVLRCPWCAGALLAETPQGLPRYRAVPAIDAARALDLMQQALGCLDPEAAPRRLDPPRLHYVPFYELHARRAGTARMDPIVPAGVPLLAAEPARPAHSLRRPATITKVVLASWSFYWPAVELVDWGLEALSPSRLRVDPGVCFERMDGDAATADGVRLEPTVNADSFRAASLRAMPAREGHVATVEEHLALVFLPLWRSGYERSGRRFSLTLDALGGEVLALTVPASPAALARQGVLLAAAAAAAAALGARLWLALAPAGVAGPLGAVSLLAAALAGVYFAAQSVLAPRDRCYRRRAGRLEPA